jgi:hypothetical protein
MMCDTWSIYSVQFLAAEQYLHESIHQQRLTNFAVKMKTPFKLQCKIWSIKPYTIY